MESATFVVCPYSAEMYSLLKPESVYRMLIKNVKTFADRGNREIAEGPTHLITDNHYGPVELWPLVLEVENDLSGTTVPPLCSG